MADKAIFHPYGVTLKFPGNDVILNAGNGMQILPSGNLITFSVQYPAGLIANGNGLAWQPPTFSDATAPKNSIYFSSTSNKLSYLDSAGTSHSLY